MARMYTCKDISTVNDLLCAMARKASDKDYVVLTQFINSSILDALIGDPSFCTYMVAKYHEHTIVGVEIRMASYYFDNREGVVLGKDCSYFGGWMDSTNLTIMLGGISRWFEYMDEKYKEVE